MMEIQKWQAGDIVLFIGDSITAAEKYTRILIDYYVLHFPEKRILFYNANIPGGSAKTILDNFETLVASRKPSAATVMLGMNDLGRSLYADSANVTESLLKKRQLQQVKYAENLAALDGLLSSIPHCFMTPTPHEESTALETPLYKGYNDALRQAASHIMATYSPALDIHKTLSAINDKRMIPTIIGPDRVHPGNIGHILIAHAILCAQGIHNPTLPMWDASITPAEKDFVRRFGIEEDLSPKNPYSDLRTAVSKRLTHLYYVEMNVLAGQGISPEDSERADAFLSSQLSMPIEPWRTEAYKDYMENRMHIPAIRQEAAEYMQKMYTA